MWHWIAFLPQQPANIPSKVLATSGWICEPGSGDSFPFLWGRLWCNEFLGWGWQLLANPATTINPDWDHAKESKSLNCWPLFVLHRRNLRRWTPDFWHFAANRSCERVAKSQPSQTIPDFHGKAFHGSSKDHGSQCNLCSRWCSRFGDGVCKLEHERPKTLGANKYNNTQQ